MTAHRSRRLSRSWARIVVVVVAALGLVPVPALAARPVPGGRYLLMQPDQSSPGLPDWSGVLQVSASGRALTSDGIPYAPAVDGYYGSYLEEPVGCGGPVSEAQFLIGAPGRPRVRLDSHGGFTTVAMSGEATVGFATVRLRGRFVSRSRAVVKVVGGTYRPGFATPPCPVPHRAFHFRLRPMPPYGSCARAPGKTVLTTSDSRVYKNWGVDEVGRDLYAYGCVFGGRAIALGDSSGDPDVGAIEQFRLVGPFVSFVSRFDNEGGHEETLGVVDLRGFGRTLRAVAPSPTNDHANEFAATPLLSSRGASAWVADCVRECTGLYEVWIADVAGPRRVDQGAGIDPESLAFHRAHVTWTNDGARRSAAVGPGERGPTGRGGRSP